MNMKETVRNHPVLAIMRKIPTEDITDYVRAAMAGGINLFEVALNSPHALEQIQLLASTFGDSILLGAGTVLSVEQAKAALDQGAQFLLSPSCPESVLSYCAHNDAAYLPGVMTPSDVGLCLSYGFDTLKLFPAGSMAANYVKNLKGPFDGTEYVAIGGVDFEHAPEFFRQGYLGIGLGSNLLDKQAVKVRDWETAARKLRENLSRIL